MHTANTLNIWNLSAWKSKHSFSPTVGLNSDWLCPTTYTHNYPTCIEYITAFFVSAFANRFENRNRFPSDNHGEVLTLVSPQPNPHQQHSHQIGNCWWCGCAWAKMVEPTWVWAKHTLTQPTHKNALTASKRWLTTLRRFTFHTLSQHTESTEGFIKLFKFSRDC